MYPISLIGTKVPILASHNYHARMAAAKRGRMWGAELLIFQDVEVLLETSSEWLLVFPLVLWSTVLITLVPRTCTWFLSLVLVLVSTDCLPLVCCGVWCSFLAAGDMFIASVKKGKPELRKKGILLVSLFDYIVMPAVVVRQRKSWRRKNGVYLYFEGGLWWNGVMNR